MTVLNAFEELNIPASYWCASGDDDCVLLTTKIWRRELREKGGLPAWFPLHPELGSDEIQYAVRERRPPDGSWTLLNLWTVQKPGDRPVCLSDPTAGVSDAAGTYSALLRQVARDNFCASWQEMAARHLDVYPEEADSSESAVAVIGADDALRELLRRTFGMSPGVAGAAVSSSPPGGGGAAFSGLQQALAVLELRRAFVVVTDQPEFTLRHLAAFSPGRLADNSRKAVFVGYQLLRAISELHRRGVFAGDLRLSDVWLDDTLWLRLRSRLTDSLCTAPAAREQEARQQRPDRPHEPSEMEEEEHDHQSLSQLTQAWVSRRLSNLDYLLALNRLCGRRLDDPAHHPVVPWVGDLSGRQTGWRDLSRSKYRLNKGDQQLDLQYHAGAVATDQVAHHISDMLSEITYYVYMARRTPRSVLCKHVRAQWVPGEYPTSLARLQAWTPDECIPQFYTDPTVFKSIHADMADLELPEWADSAAGFIADHRAALESDQVSAHLHHWIDLTFGYKLTGPAAVRAKNVCRQLAESSDTLRRHGVLQLFCLPHPSRQMALPLFSRLPPSEDVLHTPDGEADGSCAAETETEQTAAEPDDTFVAVSQTVIRLPRGYQPAAALRRIEALGAFCAAARGQLDTRRAESRQTAVDVVQARRLRDVSAWLCLLVELCAPAAFRSLPAGAPLTARLQAARQALAGADAPACLSRLRRLLDGGPAGGGASAEDGRPPPSVAALLSPPLSPLPLTHFTDALYAALAEFSWCAARQTEVEETAGRQSAEAAAAAEDWVRRFSGRLGSLLTQLSAAELQLLVPHVTHLLTARATCVLAAWHVFSPVSARLGAASARRVFLEPLLRLYRRDAITCKSMKLFHRSFLLHVAVRLGHDAFISHFISPLIEAVGGDRDLPPPPPPPAATEAAAREREQWWPGETAVGESSESDRGVFLMDDEEEAAHKRRTADSQERASIASDDVTRASVAADDVTETTESSRARTGGCLVSDVATESVMWLAHRLGPVMTSRHLARTLLRMLAVCYSDPEALKPAADRPQAVYIRDIAGDASSDRVLFCLCSIAELYGDQLILHQYLPHVSEVCGSAHRKLTSSVESALIGGLTLLLHVLPYLSDTMLMDLLQESLLSGVFQPVLRTAIDADLTFPSGAAGRAAVIYRWLSLVVMVTHRIGLEMSLQSLGGVVSHLTAMFARVFKRTESPSDQSATVSDSDVRRRARMELVQVFTPALAHAVYVPLCHLLETLCTGASAEDGELIRDLCVLHRQRSTTKPRDVASSGSAPVVPSASAGSTPSGDGGGGFGSTASAIGNRIYVEPDDSSDGARLAAASVGTGLAHHWQSRIYKEMNNDSRHLRGAWQAYWLNELAQVDSHVNPKQIRVQRFDGHTGPVREMHVLDNENSFVSASKDKTVKLWSVRSQGDGSHRSTPQWTYGGHRRPVCGVTYLSAGQRVASCDQQTLHLWDPFIGAADAVIELGNVTVLTSAPPPCPYLVCGTSEPLVRLVDTRTAAAACDWKTNAASAGAVRCLAVSGDGSWLAVGHSQGGVTTLDLRTGTVLASWRAHEAEVRQVAPLDDGSVVTCSTDSSLLVWDVRDGKARSTLRGLTEPAHFLLADGDDVITGTTTNRLGVFVGRDADAKFSSTKLKPECFKGVLSSIALLRANRLLLLGSDQGSIGLVY